MKNTSIPSWYSWLFVLVFFSILVVPLRDLNFNPNQIDEGFYGRARLILARANFRVWIGDHVFPKAVVGKDGWLFYTAEKNADDYQNVIPFSTDELARIQQNLDAVAEEYEKKGITFLIAIPPSKHSIYPEYMPDEIPVLGSESRLDQLISYLVLNGNTQLMDLRPLFLKEKKEKQIYYATDTHWNEYGAFLAYQEITKELSLTYPTIQPYPLSDYEVVEVKTTTLDIARNMGTTILKEPKLKLEYQGQLSAAFREIRLGDRRILFSSIQDSDLPRAIIYYDSFFFSTIPLLGEHFSRAMYIQNYLGGGLWRLDWVEEDDPDIVIVEFTERYIHDLDKLVKP